MTLFPCFGSDEKPVQVIEAPSKSFLKLPRLHRKRGEYSPHIEREKVFGRNCRTIDGWYFRRISSRKPKPNSKVHEKKIYTDYPLRLYTNDNPVRFLCDYICHV